MDQDSLAHRSNDRRWAGLRALKTTGYLMSRLCSMHNSIFFTYELGLCIPHAKVSPSIQSRKLISFDEATGLTTWLYYGSSSCDSAEVMTLGIPELSCSVSGTRMQSTWSSSRADPFDGIFTQWFSDSLCSPGNVTSSMAYPGSTCIALITETGCTISRHAVFGPYQKTICLGKTVDIKFLRLVHAVHETHTSIVLPYLCAGVMFTVWYCYWNSCSRP